MKKWQPLFVFHLMHDLNFSYSKTKSQKQIESDVIKKIVIWKHHFDISPFHK